MFFVFVWGLVQCPSTRVSIRVFSRSLGRKRYGHQLGDQLSSQEFACTLQQLFRGDAVDIFPPDCFSETPWNLQELKLAPGKLKSNKAANGCGLVAGLLHNAREEFFEHLAGFIQSRFVCW